MAGEFVKDKSCCRGLWVLEQIGFLAIEESIECSWPGRGGGDCGGETGLTRRRF
jgi:hypothetical protein